MSAEDREAFRAAKADGWQGWLEHNAVRLVSRDQVDPKRLNRSRWILSIKADGSQKGRLVAIGPQDPDLTTQETQESCS